MPGRYNTPRHSDLYRGDGDVRGGRFHVGKADRLFLWAMMFFQAALVFYNSLLPSVASEEHIGLVSGLGVGLGLSGTVFTPYGGVAVAHGVWISDSVSADGGNVF